MAEIGQKLTAADLCARLRVGRTTLWRMVKQGRLPAPRRIGAARVVFDEAEVAAALARAPRAGGAP